MKLIFTFLFVLSTLLDANEIKIMSYNVENLFDCKKDLYKDDWEFLPRQTKGKRQRCQQIRSSFYRDRCNRSDWTEKKLEIKLEQIKKVVEKENPDLLVIVEVENEAVLARLAKKLGYRRWIISNSFDKRGIDLGILFNATPQLNLVSYGEFKIGARRFLRHPTRNILETIFRVNGRDLLAIYINHWPSQAAPAMARAEMAQLLKKVMDMRRKENSKYYQIALGDFNVTADDSPHPFKNILLNNFFLYDVTLEKTQGVFGSYFYIPQKKWNQFDRIFISKNLLQKRGLHIDLTSCHIFSPPFISRDFKGKGGMERIPLRYNFETNYSKKAGFSDHFPVVIKLHYVQNH